MTTGLVPLWCLVLVVLCLLNMAVGVTVVVMIAISRYRDAAWWSMRDFVKDHGAVDRPPETVEEYDAERLRRSISDSE